LLTGATGTPVEINPIRYRGYYYDDETGLYYLQSRYYDAEIGRFINADDTDYIDVAGNLIDVNLFAYCDNNPVLRADKNGEFWNIVIGATVGGIAGAISSVVAQSIAGDLNLARIGVAVAGGALSGALAATGIPVNGQMIANGLIGGITSGMDTFLSADENRTALDYVSSIAIGTCIGILGGKIGGNGTDNGHLSASASRAIKRGWNAAKGVIKQGVNATIREIGKTGKYYYSQVCQQSLQCGFDAIKPIIAANIPGFLYSTIGGILK